MPDDLYRVLRETDDALNVGLRFRRAVRESDWERFDHYVKLVRTLGDTPYIHPRRILCVHETVLAALGSYRPMRTILPDLREFYLNSLDPRTAESLQYLPLILGSNLERLVIIPNEVKCHEGLPDFLTSVARLCPNIGFLQFSIDEDDIPDTLNLAINELLVGLKHLHHVDIAPFPAEIATLRHLGNLEKLTICQMIEYIGPPGDVQLAQFVAGSRGLFPRLQAVEFESSSWENLLSLILSISSPLRRLVAFVTRDISTSPNQAARARSFHNIFSALS
ncbi:hypothetical protein DXG01_016716 [Tephrocybe rancida]|nr:hypothetical protein DXG01_016716 [Tephrocybe rancida]